MEYKHSKIKASSCLLERTFLIFRHFSTISLRSKQFVLGEMLQTQKVTSVPAIY